MEKLRIEFKDGHKWNLYSDYTLDETTTFKDNILKLCCSGHTLKVYKVV
jgi:hypothetical protein